MGTKPLDLAQFEGHTPGPWEASRRDDKEGNWIDSVVGQAVNNGGYRVARMERPDCCGFVDACLIAAAPELLDECKRLRAVNAELRAALERTASFLRGEQLADALMNEGDITLGEYISAAIAKAKGEQ